MQFRGSDGLVRILSMDERVDGGPDLVEVVRWRLGEPVGAVGEGGHDRACHSRHQEALSGRETVLAVHSVQRARKRRFTIRPHRSQISPRPMALTYPSTA